MSEKEDIIEKKSKLRGEIEELLQKKGLILEEGITALNMETGESYRFEDYFELQMFLKGRKGRWYITTPGLRPSKDARPP